MSPSRYPTKDVDIVDIHRTEGESSLMEDIYRGIDPSDGKGRSLPTIILYDAQGLKLFEEITFLDEYYLTNAEIEVLSSNAKRIVSMIPDNSQLVELGSGYVFFFFFVFSPTSLLLATNCQ